MRLTRPISRPGHASKNRSRSSRRLVIESLEDRRFLKADVAWDRFEFRTIDGLGNNVARPEQGAADIVLLRVSGDAAYPDGVGDVIVGMPGPGGTTDRENPRVISNLISAQADTLPNDRRMSDFVWQWGQFLDHDLDSMETHPDNGAVPILVEDPDPLAPVIPFTRSNFALDDQGVRQQLNEITAFIDGSNVYGSHDQRASALRTFSGGMLKTSPGDLLPYNEDGLPNAGGTSPDQFLAGDVRANEQVGLTAMHTLFVREHNRLARVLAERDPSATDEQLYQLARKIVGAEIQIITYEEFLPTLLGSKAVPKYRGYDPDVDASIVNEFSTAFYRVGHTMLSPQFLLLGERQRLEGVLPLRDAFFNSDFLADDPANLDRLLRGLAAQPAQEIDNQIVDDVRNFLFGAPGDGGMDLAALNIQRGRDHGLPDYNSLRAAYGLPRVSGFDEICADPNIQLALQQLYGNVDNIDPWVGALAEDHVSRVECRSADLHFTRRSVHAAARRRPVLLPERPRSEAETGAERHPAERRQPLADHSLEYRHLEPAAGCIHGAHKFPRCFEFDPGSVGEPTRDGQHESGGLVMHHARFSGRNDQSRATAYPTRRPQSTRASAT